MILTYQVAIQRCTWIRLSCFELRRQLQGRGSHKDLRCKRPRCVGWKAEPD